MIRRLAGAALAVSASGAALTAATGPAHAAAPAAKVDFAGTVALSNCSGSVVRGPRSRDGDKALVLTNGHCLETGMPGARQVIIDRPSARTFKLLDPTGRKELGTLAATRIEYATMTDTDVTVYRLSSTYADIRRKYGISALRLSLDRPRAGTQIRVVSGYWKKIYSCKIDGFVYRMREADWTWKDAIRYTPECETIGGTSGSPIVDAGSRQVVGVNNTGNESGERCTLNNPCEVGKDGKVTVRKGTNYGQQTYLLARCLGVGNDVVLGGSCALPRPAAAR
ncbi:serine protease [Actinomadura vinacea]|uniref:Serine protease n=1 Tax=Actinomadura vinacea TaxID=115336 RepID=A0ABN3JSG0_9ACTN